MTRAMSRMNASHLATTRPPSAHQRNANLTPPQRPSVRSSRLAAPLTCEIANPVRDVEHLGDLVIWSSSTQNRCLWSIDMAELTMSAQNSADSTDIRTPSGQPRTRRSHRIHRCHRYRKRKRQSHCRSHFTPTDLFEDWAHDDGPAHRHARLSEKDPVVRFHDFEPNKTMIEARDVVRANCGLI